ncbi:hypothetical protein F4604DRAFT_1717949 [Suillus subluteus]|nr:hypothetical protein F4604DRAFT_1717949 [Suillus subluteus]
MLSALVVLCWLYSGGGQWAGVLAQSAQHAERQVGHTSPPIPPDPGLIGAVLTSSPATSPTISSTSSSSNSSHVMTSTASALAPSSTPTQLTINAVKNMTTCAPGVITWIYNGSSPNILLSITSINVLDPFPQLDLTHRQNTAGQISVTLANTSAILNSWTWPQVDQPQGWYIIEGSVASLDASSTAFFISNGSDTACLLSSPSSSPGPTSAATTSSMTLSVGEIVGIVVGSLAGLVFLVLSIAYYLCRQRRSPTRGSKPKQSVGRRWSSLRSNDSAARSLAGLGGGSTHSHGHSDAKGEILMVADSGKASETTTTQSSDECHGSHGEEKEAHPRSSRGMIPVDAINNPCRIIITAHLFIPFMIRVLFQIHHPVAALLAPVSPLCAIRNKVSSCKQLEYAHPWKAPCTCLPPLRIRPHLPSRGRDEYPPSPVAATSARRSPSTGAVSARRTSRKPVPHYEASDFCDDLHSAVDNQSMSTAGESSHSHGTESLSPLHTMSGLSHNRIHYLIPDMPPPRNE